MSDNKPLQPGDVVTVEHWLKKMGKATIDNSGKPRNVLALCKKGKFVPATICEKKDADTLVADNGKLTPFRRISLNEEVLFAQTVINVFPIAFWKKATKTNLFLGALDKKGDGVFLPGETSALDEEVLRKKQGEYEQMAQEMNDELDS